MRAVEPLVAGAGLPLPICAAAAEILQGVQPPRAPERVLIEAYRKGIG